MTSKAARGVSPPLHVFQLGPCLLWMFRATSHRQISVRSEIGACTMAGIRRYATAPCMYLPVLGTRIPTRFQSAACSRCSSLQRTAREHQTKCHNACWSLCAARSAPVNIRCDGGSQSTRPEQHLQSDTTATLVREHRCAPICSVLGLFDPATRPSEVQN